MRPSCLAVSVLVLFIFLSSVQGIRLETSFKSAKHPELHGGTDTLMKTSSNGVMGEVILCKGGHCTGKGRKLLTATTAGTSTSTTTSKSEENRENKANPTSKVQSDNQGNGEKQAKVVPVGSPTTSEHQEVEDIMEIAEMDYSPARRKPPIHN
ncbi:hypothetical protein PTKIN_Ptkin19aG0034700 [Pterospermum kingtungense]